MNKPIAAWLAVLALLLICQVSFAQATTALANTQKQTPSSQEMNAQEKNIQEYIELLRADVRHQKAEIMGAVMQFDVYQAVKFWPIYSEYDKELTQLNNQRVADIQEYANHYDQMTDAKADELVQKALDYRKQRSELLARYYGRVKDSLGAIEAARFLQVEDQLLMIIDLQIASSLPIVGEGS